MASEGEGKKRKLRTSSNEEATLQDNESMDENSSQVSDTQTLSALFQSVAQIHAKLDSLSSAQNHLHTNIHGTGGIEERLQDVTEHTNDQEGALAELRAENRKLRTEVDMLKSFIVRLERKIDEQHEEVLELKSRSMRDNLILHGLKEKAKETDEDLREAFKSVMKEGLAIKKDIPVERIHRIGKKNSSKQRPVIVKFASCRDRELVLENKKKLVDTRAELHFSPQFPEEIRARRSRAFDVQKQYDSNRVKTKILHDRLLFVESGTTFREKVQRPTAEEVLETVTSSMQNEGEIKCSAKVHVKKNSVQARVVSVNTVKQARAAVQNMVSQPEMIRARANTVIYRIQTDTNNDTVVDGYDDDREIGMGKHVLQLLRKADIKNVVMVITREGEKRMWPQRFASATECVKDVLKIECD